MFQSRKPDPEAERIRRIATTAIQGRLQLDPLVCPYFLPNTDREMQRLNLQHYILRQLLQGDTYAPIGGVRPRYVPENHDGTWTNAILGRILNEQQAGVLPPPSRVLDVGCGNSRWGIEIARHFPQAEVVGIDIVAPEKTYSDNQPAPRNYRFSIGNMLERQPFPDATFDYVHLRMLSLGMCAQTWLPLIQEMARITAPGGWLESIEFGLPTQCGPALARFTQAIEIVMIARGLDIAQVRMVESALRRSPLPIENIQSRVVDVPIGAHGGAIGQRMAWHTLLLVANLESLCVQVGLFTIDAWKRLRMETEQELQSGVYQPTIPLYLTIGRRQHG